MKIGDTVVCIRNYGPLGGRICLPHWPQKGDKGVIKHVSGKMIILHEFTWRDGRNISFDGSWWEVDTPLEDKIDVSVKIPCINKDNI